MPILAKVPEELTRHRTVLRNARVPCALANVPAQAAGGRVGDLFDVNLLVEQGRGRAFIADADVPGDAVSLDVGNRIVMPCLAEPHIHLDKCHTVSRLDDMGGDLLHAIEAQARDQQNWTAHDIRVRATRGVAELVASGCRLARTHVDWPDREPPLAWHVLGEVATQCATQLKLQRAALIDLARCDDVEAMTHRAHTIASHGGVLGIYLRGHADTARRLSVVFDLAERFSLPLDFHVDEDAGALPQGLQAVVAEALERKFEGPLLCGHACALVNLDGDPLRRLIDDTSRAGISIVALPSTNLYLQGRGGELPSQRGMTRVKQLRSGGVGVALGADNVADAFCPGGQYDPFVTLGLAVLVAQLDPPYGSWLDSITTAAERAVGEVSQPLETKRCEDMLLVDATHTTELLRSPARRTVSSFLTCGGRDT